MIETTKHNQGLERLLNRLTGARQFRVRGTLESCVRRSKGESRVSSNVALLMVTKGLSASCCRGESPFPRGSRRCRVRPRHYESLIGDSPGLRSETRLWEIPR